MRYLILLSVFFVPSAFAADFALFTAIGEIMESIWVFFTVDIPHFINRLFVYLVKFFVFLKFNALIASTEFAYSVAKLMLEQLTLSDVINNSIGNLNSDIVQTLIDVNFFSGAQLIIEAFVTRYVLDILGW